MTAETENYDICVLGLGYVGLPTASMFAARRKAVLGVDVRPEVVRTIRNGGIHIREPDLDVLVHAGVVSGNLLVGEEVAPADHFIIAVPTPLLDEGDRRRPDLDSVRAAARSLAPVVEPGNLIVVESTIPVGTTEKVREWLAEALEAIGRPVDVETLMFAHCPERVLPGRILAELIDNERLVGGLSPEAAERAARLYRAFCTGRIFQTDARTAELAKLTENAYRDVNIAFANELSMVCDALEIDVWEVISLANRHPRVNILNPGPGVGGHCIAVDPFFIIDSVPEATDLMRTARKVNDAKVDFVVAQAASVARESGTKRVACLGLAYKADVDDLRESPALAVVRKLSRDHDVLAVEPNIERLPDSLVGCARLVALEEALEDAELLLILVDHREFREIDRLELAGKRVIDTRGIYRDRTVL